MISVDVEKDVFLLILIFLLFFQVTGSMALIVLKCGICGVLSHIEEYAVHNVSFNFFYCIKLIKLKDELRCFTK
jgi:hypothetical protein